ncbi:hypothetical protein ABEB36_012626 [Hypothenemus hampei]|uniref:MADF domain-containing protein n=1 Tax=Hypothenemus hampei TaxID=57062 RepID=A0ABD1EBW7_HYPHA
MDNSTEKLIEHVKKHSILFDLSHPEYKNVRAKHKVWDQIAKDMQLRTGTGNDLKKRWKNLKDCYSKYIRSENSQTEHVSKNISRYKYWPWGQHMEAFRPFMQIAKNESNVIDVSKPTVEPSIFEKNSAEVNAEINLSAERNELSIDQEKSRVKPSRVLKKKQKSNKVISTAAHNVTNYLERRSTDIQLHYDDIDLIFQGYAASVKRLSVRRRTIIKFKIAKLIMEEELAEQEDMLEQSHPGTSSSIKCLSSELPLLLPHDGITLSYSKNVPSENIVE